MTPEFAATADRRSGICLLDTGEPHGERRSFLYYVLAKPPSPRLPCSIEDCWAGRTENDGKDRRGWYVFVDRRISKARLARFGRRVRRKLPDVSSPATGFTRRVIAWIPRVDRWIVPTRRRRPPVTRPGREPEARCLLLEQYGFQFPARRRVVAPGLELGWSRDVRLRVPEGARVECLSGGDPRFEISLDALELRDRRGGLTGVFPPVGGPVLEIPLTGDQGGALRFRFRSYPTLSEHAVRSHPLRPKAEAEVGETWKPISSWEALGGPAP